ncbi:MAG: DUF308 domain-containing protein [Butyrivibrio sp.]|nr:DUF308 domain-containing protein [Butyrivibrio sp.]
MGALKKIKPDYATKAIVMVAIGVLLAFWTEASLDFMARALAVLLVIIGVVFIVTYFVKKERTFIISGGLAAGIIVAAIGGWIFVNPGTFTDFIPKLFGIFILVSGLGNLWQAISLIKYKSKAWWVSLLIALVTVGLGGYLLFNPTDAKEIAVTLIGIFLIVDGVTNLISALIVGAAYNRYEQEKNAIDVEAQIVESDKKDEE